MGLTWHVITRDGDYYGITDTRDSRKDVTRLTGV